LTIKGKDRWYCAEPVTADSDFIKVIEVYKRERPNELEQYWGVPKDAAGVDWLKVKEKCAFVRFRPVK
jgi:hypothetical protein